MLNKSLLDHTNFSLLVFLLAALIQIFCRSVFMFYVTAGLKNVI